MLRGTYVWWMPAPLDFQFFTNWLHEMDQFFEPVGLSNTKKVRLVKKNGAMDYCDGVENLCHRLDKPAVTDWEEMKVKLWVYIYFNPIERDI